MLIGLIYSANIAVTYTVTFIFPVSTSKVDKLAFGNIF